MSLEQNYKLLMLSPVSAAFKEENEFEYEVSAYVHMLVQTLLATDCGKFWLLKITIQPVVN